MIKFDNDEFLKPQIYSTNDEYETRCNVTKEIVDDIKQLQQENQELKKQYCERTDCSGRLGNSKKVDQLEKELEQLKEIEKEHQRINGRLHLEIKELKDIIDKAVEYIEKHRQIYDIDGSVEPKIDEFSILASPKYLIDLLKGDKE